MLKTKSILRPRESEDGLRISIMSRHTLNDGITPHPLINTSSYDGWFPILAPPVDLVGDYYKRGLPWSCFEKRYLDHIREARIKIEVEKLAQRGLRNTITLLCIEENPTFCHRRLLAEECKRYQPALSLKIE